MRMSLYRFAHRSLAKALNSKCSRRDRLSSERSSVASSMTEPRTAVTLKVFSATFVQEVQKISGSSERFVPGPQKSN